MPIQNIVQKVYPFAPVALALLFAVLLLSVVRTSVFGHVEEEKHVFFEITVLLLLAILAELAVVYLKQPSVMILLLLGILLGPGFLEMVSGLVSGWLGREVHLQIIRAPEVVHVFAQLGAIFLLFKVGLHSHFHKIFSKENFLVAALGVVVPFLAGYLYATATGGNFAYSMFLGAALTATSVGVTVALLKEANLLKTRFADVIIGAAVIDDILALLVLAFVINLSAASASATPLYLVLISVVVFLAGGIVAGRMFISKIIDVMDLENKTFLLVMAFLLAYAYLAEFIGLSSIVGAFLAGVLLNYSRHIHEIEQKTYALEILFTPIFFISLGMLVDVQAMGAFFIPILLITIIALITKLIGCGLGAWIAKLGKTESAIVGIGMAPRGEVALIIGLLGLTTGVLSDTEYTIIASMALLTTLVTPPLLGYLIRKGGENYAACEMPLAARETGVHEGG